MLICQVFPPIGTAIRNLTFKFPKIGSPAFKLYSIVQQSVIRRIDQREADKRKGIDPGEPQDFIDLFLNAKSDVDFGKEANEDFTKRNMRVTKQLTAEEVVGQCFLFLIAGFDTTALSLSYATYLIATHPEIQQKLQDEVDREVSGADVTFEELGKLKYMELVMKEAVRMFPLASM